MKEIVLSASVFKAALPGLSKVIGRKSYMPVLQHLRIGRDEEGTVRLQGTDLDGFATYTVKETGAGPPVEMLVPMDQLAKTVKTLGADDMIGFTAETKDRVKLRYLIGGSQVERVINSLPVDEFPPIPTINQPSIPLEPAFGLALRQALTCCSENASRPVLNGACLDVSDPKFHYVVATNGGALYSANSFAFDLKKSVIIPDSKFLEWPDFLDKKPGTLSVEPGQKAQKARNGKPAKEATPGWVKLESGCWSFITKETEGEYPNWRQVACETNANWTRISFSETAIKQMLLLIPNLPGDDGYNQAVRLRVDQYLFVEGRNRDEEEWTSIPIQDVMITGKPITLGLNRKYLLNGLRFGLNLLEIEHALTPVMLSKGGKKMVICPLNLDPKEETPPTQPPSAPTPPATPPPATQPPEPSTQERIEMPKNTNSTETTQTKTQPELATVKSLVEHVEQIKESLKSTMRELTALADLLKQAEKEKRTTEKEIESVRSKLKQIQNVNI